MAKMAGVAHPLVAFRAAVALGRQAHTLSVVPAVALAAVKHELCQRLLTDAGHDLAGVGRGAFRVNHKLGRAQQQSHALRLHLQLLQPGTTKEQTKNEQEKGAGLRG